MTVRAQPSPQPSDRVAAANGRRVWVILVVAPLLWLGLWLAGRTLWPQVSGGVIGQISQSLRPWVTLVTEISLLMWVALWLRKAGRGLADIGLTADWLGRETLVGLLAGLILWVVAQVPLWLLGFRDMNPASGLRLTVGTPTRLLYVIGVAVCEEVIWRGYAITELHRLYRLSASVVIAVIAFAVFYLGQTVLVDWLTLPLMLYVGGWLSVLYLWRRSLIAPMVAHVVLGGLGFV